MKLNEDIFSGGSVKSGVTCWKAEDWRRQLLAPRAHFHLLPAGSMSHQSHSVLDINLPFLHTECLLTPETIEEWIFFF